MPDLAQKGIKIPKCGHKIITYRSFTKFDKEAFLLELAQSPLSHVYQYTDPDKAFEIWHSNFVNVYNKHAPLITRRVIYSPKLPWYTDKVQHAAQVRDNLLKEVIQLKHSK